MTYVIKRNKKRYNNKQYSSYEEARNFVRKLVRSGKIYNDVLSYADVLENNIPLSRIGFSIQRVA